MDKIANYRQIIKSILCNYAGLSNKQPRAGIETDLIFDEERDHYLLINNGWDGRRRILSITVYVRIRNGKFWIEEDWLEQGIATDLLETGVPNEDIVLAFHHPSKRPFTEFAVA